MSKRPVTALFALGALLVLSWVASAAGPQGQTPGQMTGADDKTVTVTGCLQKAGDNRFTLVGDDGKTYDLQNTNANFAPHVGHKLSVTGEIQQGQASRETPKSEKPSEAAQTETHIQLNVKKAQMVSTSCS